MSATIYRQMEALRSGGKPSELYHFFRSTEDWFHTSGSVTVIDEDSNVYLPLEITRGEIDAGGADRPGALPVTIPVDCDLGLAIQSGSTPTPIQLRITRSHRGVADSDAIIFIGELSTADADEGDVLQLQCLPFTARLGDNIPQGAFQRDQCAFTTYDPTTCKVDPANFTFVGEVTAIDGLVITVDGASDFVPLLPGSVTDPFMFKLGSAVFGEQQTMIEEQDGDNLTLLEDIGLEIGSMVTLIAGDDRAPSTCSAKFQNSARNMSFKDMPTVNPFYGQGLRP